MISRCPPMICAPGLRCVELSMNFGYMLDDPRYARSNGSFSVLAARGDGQSADVYRLDRAGTPPLRAQVDLARSAAFAIAGVRVDPATRQVMHPDGTPETLEPRVMEVLVALHRAGGAILSRDDLIASCWRGMVVGEDAIQRVIQRLRKLAAATGAFRIETITRVGYRLLAADNATIDDRKAGTPRGRGRAFVTAVTLAVTALVLVAVAFGFRALQDTAASPPHHLALLSPQDAKSSYRTRSFETALKAQLVERGVPLATSADDLVLTPSLRENSAKIVASAVFENPATGRTLWAGSKEFPAGAEGDRIAVAWITDLVGCAFRWLKDEPGATASPAMPALMKFCEVEGTSDFTRQFEIGREMIAADRTSPLGYYAVATAAHGLDLAVIGTPATHAEGVSAIMQYRKLRPDLSRGIAQQAILVPPSHAVERELLLRSATDPKLVHREVSFAYLGDMLIQSGRAGDALGAYRSAVAEAPQDFLDLLRYYNAADVLGLQGTADKMAAKILAMPGGGAHALFIDLKRGLGHHDHAALYRASSHVSANKDPFARAVVQSLDAIASGDVAKRQAAARSLAGAPPIEGGDSFRVELYGALGDFDRAFALMDVSRRYGRDYSAPGASPGLVQPIAWSPALRSLRRDPRFTLWLERAGFFDYWRATKSRPDECGGRYPPPYCARIG